MSAELHGYAFSDAVVLRNGRDAGLQAIESSRRQRVCSVNQIPGKRAVRVLVSPVVSLSQANPSPSSLCCISALVVGHMNDPFALPVFLHGEPFETANE